jgi:hypothetical protein
MPMVSRSALVPSFSEVNDPDRHVLHGDTGFFHGLDQLLIERLVRAGRDGILALVSCNQMSWPQRLHFVHLDIVRVDGKVVDENLLWLG